MMWSSTATPSNRPNNSGPTSSSGSGPWALSCIPTRRRSCTAKTRSAVTRRSTPASTFSATPSGVAWPVADEAFFVASHQRWPQGDDRRLFRELLTSGEPQGEAGDRRTDQGLAPQPSQCNGPCRTRPGHQRPDPRLVQLLRGLLPPASCMPSQRASTNILSDGRCRSSNDCEANPPKHGDGSTLPVSASHNSSLTGTSSLQPNAELWEPYDGRLSRTVLTEREGEVPSRHSPGGSLPPLTTPQTRDTPPRVVSGLRRGMPLRVVVHRL